MRILVKEKNNNFSFDNIFNQGFNQYLINFFTSIAINQNQFQQAFTMNAFQQHYHNLNLMELFKNKNGFS